MSGGGMMIPATAYAQWKRDATHGRASGSGAGAGAGAGDAKTTAAVGPAVAPSAAATAAEQSASSENSKVHHRAAPANSNSGVASEETPSSPPAGITVEQSPNGTIIHHKPTPADVFEESVYSLIPVEYTPPAKQNMYRSKFASQAKQEYVSGKKKTASMGPAKIEVRTTDGFLKKGHGEKLKSKVSETFSPDRTVRKAAVPKELGVAPPKSKKDFIRLNALDNINSEAKKPADNSPQYRHKKDYGSVPAYLVNRGKEQKEKNSKVVEKSEANTANGAAAARELKEGIVPLPEEERQRILDGLKANWEKLNSDYQKLSLTVDTVPKIARKVNMEQQLKHLEDHIAKFSHPAIMVNFSNAYR